MAGAYFNPLNMTLHYYQDSVTKLIALARSEEEAYYYICLMAKANGLDKPELDTIAFLRDPEVIEEEVKKERAY